MWWRFVVVAALLAAAGCEPGAQDTAEVEAPPALVCTEGMFELMAFRGDVWESNVEGTRTELQQRAQGACQCLSAALTPADYDFVEDLASFQLWALRELQQFSTRQQEVGPRLIERADGGPLQEGGGPQWAQLEQEMRQLAQRPSGSGASSSLAKAQALYTSFDWPTISRDSIRRSCQWTPTTIAIMQSNRPSPDAAASISSKALSGFGIEGMAHTFHGRYSVNMR